MNLATGMKRRFESRSLATQEPPSLGMVLRLTVMKFNARAVAERGREIYDSHRQKIEPDHRGQFVAIDVTSERLFFGDSPEAAYRAARKERIEGPFHFVRVGLEAQRSRALGTNH
jgi:hypothetical protein